MTILVKIYGDLIKKIENDRKSISKPLSLNLPAEKNIRISNILDILGITENETSYIYVNSLYSGMTKKVKSGDRVGIFPKKHGIIFTWHYKPAEDD